MSFIFFPIELLNNSAKKSLYSNTRIIKRDIESLYFVEQLGEASFRTSCIVSNSLWAGLIGSLISSKNCMNYLAKLGNEIAKKHSSLQSIYGLNCLIRWLTVRTLPISSLHLRARGRGSTATDQTWSSTFGQVTRRASLAARGWLAPGKMTPPGLFWNWKSPSTCRAALPPPLSLFGGGPDAGQPCGGNCATAMHAFFF